MLILDQPSNKLAIRALLEPARAEHLQRGLLRARKAWGSLGHYFVEGRSLVPECIAPRLIEVKTGTWESELFFLATRFWSVPLSAGYGRRTRFLVWDDYHDSVIGLLALGDPVFNMKCRDSLIGWTAAQRSLYLKGILDCFILGAVPPYSQLLGGKLIASLACSRDVVDWVNQKYSGRRSVILGSKHEATPLVGLTVSSALGRSSLYNRLRLRGRLLFRPIGYTQGFGHFHVSSSMYEMLRGVIRDKYPQYLKSSIYGSGPSYKMRLIRKALHSLGLGESLLYHGVRRQVFMAELADNSRDVLLGNSSKASYHGLQTAAVASAAALERWVLPRAQRDRRYLAHTASSTAELLFGADNEAFDSEPC